MIDPLLLTATPVLTFDGPTALTNASGFFFEHDGRLYLVTSRHVLLDEASGHRPDRIEIVLHTDPRNMAQSAAFSIPLYRDGASLWRDGRDGGGAVDVAAIPLDRAVLPRDLAYRAFSPAHLAPGADGAVGIGATTLIVGYPLGFHDTLHNLPIVRQAAVASSFGFRFTGLGYFLTDARTHRGISGAPVVMRADGHDGASATLPWMLLGIHSSRLDIGTRDLRLDEALGLNCAWYADILPTLTQA